MALEVPQWLAQRGGEMRQDPNRLSWSVLIEAQPQYRLLPFPVAGKYGCHVMQTNNGRHLEKGGTYSSEKDAVLGGLDDLRQALGW